jgi:hypothetical protein
MARGSKEPDMEWFVARGIHEQEQQTKQAFETKMGRSIGIDIDTHHVLNIVGYDAY